MADLAMAFQQSVIGILMARCARERTGRGQMVLSGTQPYYAAYRTRDNKWLTLCPLEPKFWGNMCRALDRQDLIPQQYDPTRSGALLAELRQIFLTRTRDEWFDLLARADVPVGKVLDLDEISSDPQLVHRQMVIEMEHPELGRVRQLGFGIKLSDTPGTIRRLGGLPGQDTDMVLGAAGYSPAELDELRRQGAIYQAGR